MTQAISKPGLVYRVQNATRHAGWHLRMAIARGRWTVLVALILVLASALIGAKVLLPLHGRVLELQAATLRAAMKRPVLPPPNGTVDGVPHALEAGLVPWAERLALVSERVAILDGIYEAAPKHNLYLTQAQFRWTGKALPMPEPTAGASTSDSLQALEIVMPVKGAYKDVREFVGEVLENNPSLALDAMGIARETPGGARLLVDLRFTLYLRGSV